MIATLFLVNTNREEAPFIMRMFSKSMLVITFLIPFLLAGCFTQTLMVKYYPNRGAPVNYNVNRRITVAVFPFADLRGAEPMRIGGIYGPVRENYTSLYMPEKPTVFFGRALADELELAGFVVVDQTRAAVLPEGVSVLDAAKALRKLNPLLDIAIYGQVKKMEVNSFYGYRTELEVKIFLVDMRSEKLAWSGTVTVSVVDVETQTGGLLDVMADRLAETINLGLKDLLRDNGFREAINSFM